MWRHGWGMYDWGWWFWPHGPVFWLLVIAVAVGLVVWLIRTPARPDAAASGERRSRGLDALDERYARGEIGRDEYLQKRRDILG